VNEINGYVRQRIDSRRITDGQSFWVWRNGHPTVRGDTSYDPETITLLRSVLDAAWNSLSPAQQARISKSALAEGVLKLAARGERDPGRLRVSAIVEVIPYYPQP
jgi:hypothetical protein